MKGITLLGMVCSGHDGFPPRPSVSAEGQLRVQGRAVVMNGDRYDIHCNNVCHDGVGIATTTQLRANGRNMLLTGDPISCGSTVAEVFANIRVHV